jgi:serine/threonine protein kinase
MSRVGNVNTSAPQLIFGEGYDYKYDVWALGILFYKLLVGFLPFPVDCNETLEEE